MKITCAWCGKEIGEKTSEHSGTSHGICESCKRKMLKKHKSVK